MSIVVNRSYILVNGEIIFESPTPIRETAILDDGIIVIYDAKSFLPIKSPVGASGSREPTEEEMEQALRNVKRIDFKGNVVWQIRRGLSDSGGSVGYDGIGERTSSDLWRIFSTKYLFYLNIETGETYLDKD